MGCAHATRRPASHYPGVTAEGDQHPAETARLLHRNLSYPVGVSSCAVELTTIELSSATIIVTIIIITISIIILTA
jgi:hypothetical protein